MLQLPDCVLKYVFFAFAYLYAPLVYADCTIARADTRSEKVTVAKIIDGDTLILVDKRRIRLIGINTPERARDANSRYGAKPAHPYAARASEHLQSMVGEGDIDLVWDVERRDKYKRFLAHPFNSEGVNITQAMLEAGLGFAVAIAPNLLFSHCYFLAEDKAREVSRGVWAHQFFAPIQTSQLAHTDRDGFVFINGVIDKLQATRQGALVQFKGNFVLLIKYGDMPYFSNLSTWSGRTARVRGWLIDKGKNTKPWHKRWMMVLSHPLMIDVAEH